mgnify:CR=1 FL=1
MQVRKFEAHSLEQALAQVKKAMGPDALILSTQQVKRKWYQKPTFEVAAASPAAKAEEHFDDDRMAEIFPHRKIESELVPVTYGTPVKKSVQQQERSAPSQKAGHAAYRSSSSTPMVHHERGRRESAPRQNPNRDNNGKNPHETYFEERGFSATTSRDFVRRILLDFSQSDRGDEQFMNRERVKLVSAGIKTLSMETLERRKHWAVVGNPGVGKTATCVKLAVHLQGRKQEVSLVSADKRKLVGEQELSSYARMLGVPYYSIFGGKRPTSGIEIIDTPAMGFIQPELASELEKVCRESSVLLVLDAGQRLDELLRWVHEAEALSPVGIFFTRVDLIRGAGVIHDVLKAAKIPLLGISNGAGLRNSLEFFEPADLARTLLKIQPHVTYSPSA